MVSDSSLSYTVIYFLPFVDQTNVGEDTGTFCIDYLVLEKDDWDV